MAQVFSAKLGHDGGIETPPSQAYLWFVGNADRRTYAWKKEGNHGYSRDAETDSARTKQSCDCEGHERGSEDRARYREWAEEQGLLAGPLPPLGDLHQLLKETLNSVAPPQNISTVEPYRELVAKLRKGGVEIAAISERLREQGYSGSYASVYRFVNRLEPRAPDATVRVETRPGEEAQVDFGYAGKMIDAETGGLRKTWAFVMTLSWSRHQYVEFVFDQKAWTWLRLHRNAFTFLGGVPGRVVPDNLKAAIIHQCWGAEPQAQQSYRECAEHYDFLIAPCRPRKPEHKGKVESGVHYVKRNFLGGREATSIEQANRDVQRWINTTAGSAFTGRSKRNR